jgi:uncharacterized protein (DUF488 family)
MPELLTVGHGQSTQAELADRLRAAGVELLVDVRRFPGSRSSPHLHRDELASWLPAAGIGYRWEERLGGRRRLPAGEPVVDTWWRVTSFQAYAAHTRTAEFRSAAAGLVAEVRATAGHVAVMCSELLWWRCHRRLICDVAVLAHGLAVAHVMPNGSRQPHLVAAGAVLVGPEQVTWPAGT